MNVFIDTNVFLSFYHYSNDALEELQKLSVLLEQGKLHLFLPQQVADEYYRNREGKIADVLKKLREQKLDLPFPEFCKEYPEYEDLRNLQRSYSKTHAQLLGKLIEDVRGRKLKADAVIQGLFGHATQLPRDEDIFEQAQDRMAVGNPPGKAGSLGDAINWECLLSHVPIGEKLYFIADDSDYASPVDPEAFNVFLLEEWHEQKKADIFFYRRLSDFFHEHFPDIKLASELEKDLLIQKLGDSPTFSATHSIVYRLSKLQGFSIAQINTILKVANSNNQVYWIISDEDVETFLLDLVKGKEDKLDQLALNEMLANMGEAHQEPETEPSDREDEIPF
jgi:predicted nucleic acid-binding protein